MKRTKGPLNGIHTFLSNHIPSYNKNNSVHLIVLFYKTVDAQSKWAFKRKARYVQANWEQFRQWFFSKDRERLPFEQYNIKNKN